MLIGIWEFCREAKSQAGIVSGVTREGRFLQVGLESVVKITILEDGEESLRSVGGQVLINGFLRVEDVVCCAGEA